MLLRLGTSRAFWETMVRRRRIFVNLVIVLITLPHFANFSNGRFTGIGEGGPAVRGIVRQTRISQFSFSPAIPAPVHHAAQWQCPKGTVATVA